MGGRERPGPHHYIMTAITHVHHTHFSLSFLRSTLDDICVTEVIHHSSTENRCVLAIFVPMNPPEIYICILGGIFALLGLRCINRFIRQAAADLKVVFYKHLIYPPVWKDWPGPGRWTRIKLIRRILYIAINLFLLFFRNSTADTIGPMAGVLAGINIVPLYFGFHHAAAADLLGLSLSTFRSLHAEIALMTTSMGAIHSAIMLLKGPKFVWSETVHLHGATVSSLTSPCSVH